MLASWRAAAAGKRGSAAAARFEYRLADHLCRLQDALVTQCWRPGAYSRFEVHQPKRRTISAAPFADRVVHHALMRVTAPRLERLFSPCSHANRHGMGTLSALEAASSACRRRRWALRLDVQQHFPSIDHALLLAALEPLMPEPGLRWLVRSIIAGGATPADELPPAVLLPGDDLLSAAGRPRGLPIGNLTSQWWSNAYLDLLDQFVVRGLGCRDYVRYVDDMLLAHDDAKTLADWGRAVREFALHRLRLRLHAHSAHLQPVASGVPWLGHVVYPEHRRLKSRKVVATTRRLARAWEQVHDGSARFAEFDARVQGWIAHAAHSRSRGIRERVLARFDITPFVEQLPARRRS
ncbi:MAG: RNA-directed DNA polymerase [Hydrogenophaga sp.]|nr:RNA-directed DNA polymerase [Hydrogenophaga sp.]